MPKDDDSKIESIVLTARSALLDFYSDRAGAFGSFFLAAIFGLVAMLSIVPQIGDLLKGLSLFPFIAFAYTGYYTFRRFAFYAQVAHILEHGGIRCTAKLDTIPIPKEETGDICANNLDEFTIKTSKKHERLIGKILLNRTVKIPSFEIPTFNLLYFLLMMSLGLLVYCPLLLKVLDFLKSSFSIM